MDPVKLEVLRNALEGIADGMALTVMRTSRSSVVRQSLDYSTGLLDARGELIAQGMSQPLHLGGMSVALAACLAAYGGKVEPGDVLANNDPYEGGSHLPDIFLFKPIFDGERLLGYACAMSHHTDVGGRVAGGNACDSSEIFQEGLRIPPLKLYERGVPNQTLFRIIEKAVRVPDKVLGDIRGQLAALTFAEREFVRLVEEVGRAELPALLQELVDYTERLTRAAIRLLPDGEWTFTDYGDDDGFDAGPIAIVARLSKRGEEIAVDFAGTSPQCKGALNPVLASTRAVVYAVMRCILPPEIPNTAGYFRPMTVSAPPGTFVNPLPPAPVGARALGALRAAQALFGAFAQMLPDRIPACSGGCELGIAMAGYDKSVLPWRPWVQLEFHNEQAIGGRPTKDGIDAQCMTLNNLANIPVEVLEAEQPLKIDEYAIVPDTEGAGKYRGGLGMVRQYRFLMDETTLQVRSDRIRHAQYGLAGGQPAALTRIVLSQNGTERTMPSKFLATVNRGDVLRVVWSGAGGWGDPLERDPAPVLRDVVAEKITPARARDVYGVIVDAARRAVDAAATARERLSRRAAAG